MSPEEAPLTEAELREIAELEKIVKFRDDILAGRHPRIKIINGRAVEVPVPVLVSAPVRTSASALNINFSYDYYRCLGVGPLVAADSIRRAYQHKCIEFNPDSLRAQMRRKRGGHPALNADRYWAEIQEGYRILSDPVLRRAYDDVRKELELDTTRKRASRGF